MASTRQREGLAGAVLAKTENVNDVIRLRETVLGGNLASPLFDSIRLDLDRKTTIATNQVMVMSARGARTVEALALLLQRVGLALSREIGKSTVHSRQPNG
jgi:hypothetical protein